MTDSLDFDGDFDPGFDRDALIEQAARRIELNAASLGPASHDEASEMAEVTRAFAKDQATFGRPRIDRVDMSVFDPDRGPIPVSVSELSRNASFYCLSFPISLFSRPGRGFNRLEVKVEFNPDQPGVRPTSFDVLPDQHWATKFKVGAEVSAGVTADLKLAVDVPPELAALAGLPAGAGAQAGASGRLLLGPFDYELRMPRVVHSPPGHDHVFWRLDGGKFVREQDPGLRVVLRVPHSVDGLTVTSYLQATRYYNLLQSKLKEAIADLPDALVSFFTRGTPIQARDTWNLTEDL